MEASASASAPAGGEEKVVLPLITCFRCHSRRTICLEAHTVKNNGRYFYICPSRKRDGSGYDFWYWEEDYEKMLMKRAYVPFNYIPVFEVNRNVKIGEDLDIGVEECSQPLLAAQDNQQGSVREETVAIVADGCMSEKLALLADRSREIVFLLKCVLVACFLLLVSVLYGIFRHT